MSGKIRFNRQAHRRSVPPPPPRPHRFPMKGEDAVAALTVAGVDATLPKWENFKLDVRALPPASGLSDALDVAVRMQHPVLGPEPLEKRFPAAVRIGAEKAEIEAAVRERAMQALGETLGWLLDEFRKMAPGGGG